MMLDGLFDLALDPGCMEHRLDLLRLREVAGDRDLNHARHDFTSTST